MNQMNQMDRVPIDRRKTRLLHAKANELARRLCGELDTKDSGTYCVLMTFGDWRSVYFFDREELSVKTLEELERAVDCHNETHLPSYVCPPGKP